MRLTYPFVEDLEAPQSKRSLLMNIGALGTLQLRSLASCSLNIHQHRIDR